MGSIATRELIAANDVHETLRDLPETFNQAKRMTGHSIEDVVYAMQDITSDELSKSIGSWQRKTDHDIAFMQRDKLIKHFREVENFTSAYIKAFPEKLQHEAYYDQGGFMQHNSRAFVRSRFVEYTKDPVVSRIYLNPEYEDVLKIYNEIIVRSEMEHLRFKAKVFGSVRQKERMAEWLEDEKRVKLDPIVIYGYADSQDALLSITNEVYRRHQESFAGRRIGGIPMKLADGYAVGQEPTGLSGVKSLTSSREELLYGVLNDLEIANKNWDEVSQDVRKRAFAAAVRKRIKVHNLAADPENIAFEK